VTAELQSLSDLTQARLRLGQSAFWNNRSQGLHRRYERFASCDERASCALSGLVRRCSCVSREMVPADETCKSLAMLCATGQPGWRGACGLVGMPESLKRERSMNHRRLMSEAPVSHNIHREDNRRLIALIGGSLVFLAGAGAYALAALLDIAIAIPLLREFPFYWPITATSLVLLAWPLVIGLILVRDQRWDHDGDRSSEILIDAATFLCIGIASVVASIVLVGFYLGFVVNVDVP
jgi:hypothetical protein